MAVRWAEITGRGVLAGAAADMATFERGMLSGGSNIRPIGAYPPATLRFSQGAPVHGFDPAAHFDERTLGGLDRFTQFAAVAARQAWAEAGMAGDSTPGERIGVVIGTANAGIDILEIGWKRILGEGKKPMPLTIPMTMGNAPASRIAREIGARGPVFAVTTACASASHAMLLGLMLLRNDLADVMVVGGTDSCFNGGFLQAWDGLRVVSPTICRPFSKDRQGLTIGEGAGIIVLEKPGRATARGARVHGRLTGAAMSSDASDLTTPDGVGMRAAMLGALADAGLASEDIDYINAHGTGTIANDKLEAKAIHEVFGARAARLPVSSSKSALGHAMGASGALELLVTLSGLNAGIAPPTLNFNQPDPECALDVVPEGPRQVAMRHALSNSFAFGGLNVTLALSRADADKA